MADFSGIRFLPQRPLLRELSADRLNSILTEIKRNKPKGERGITVRQSGDGTYIGLAASLNTGSQGSAEPPHPFKITSRPDPETANQFIVTINVGTINGILPSGLLDEGGVTKYFVAKSATKYVVLTAVTDGRVITGASIDVAESAAEPQTPTPFGVPTTAQFLIGVIANGTGFNAVNNSILVSGRQQYVEPRTAGPSELPYTIYYVLA
jgi:hypothetical protein